MSDTVTVPMEARKRPTGAFREDAPLKPGERRATGPGRQAPAAPPTSGAAGKVDDLARALMLPLGVPMPTMT